MCSGAPRPHLSIPASNCSLEDPGEELVGLILTWPGGGGPRPLPLPGGGVGGVATCAGVPPPPQPEPTSPWFAQACPTQMLVVPVFLPPPPLPAVAKLHQKTPLLCVNCSISTICQVDGSHQAGSSRMFPREKQTCWLAFRPPWHTWGTCLCSQTQDRSGGQMSGQCGHSDVEASRNYISVDRQGNGKQRHRRQW